VAAGGNLRTLEHSQPAAELTGVTITAGVGEVEVVGDNGDTVRARVEIKRKHMGWFAQELGRDRVWRSSPRSRPTTSLRLKPDSRDDHDRRGLDRLRPDRFSAKSSSGSVMQRSST
jgi:hypothetical protein